MRKGLNPVEYTIFVQRSFLITAATTFFVMLLMFVLVDPTKGLYIIYAFLLLLFLFFASIFCLLSFWWFFSIKKEILSTSQVNQLIGQSVVSSSVLVCFVVMYQTKVLNIWSGGFLFLCYALYQVWVNSRSD